MESQVFVELDNVTFRYSNNEVLHGISFKLRRGQVAGLLGPNGAGKSTTIKIMAGILIPARGSLRVNGVTLPGDAVSVKEQIGYVPETAGFFESLSGQ